MFQLFIKGGPVMLLLFLCSFVGVYVIIQKYLYLKVNQIDDDYYLDKIKNKLITVGKAESIRQLKLERKLMLRVLAGAIKLSDGSSDEIQNGIKEVTYLELPKLEKNMNILSSIITVAPLLGLLGTVIGLMKIFNVISGGNLGDPTMLSAGIAQALITTVTGLAIAIPFIFLYQYLSHRIEMFILSTEKVVNEILNFCKSHGGVQP
jgi:biopolymer transport protein ExbB